MIFKNFLKSTFTLQRENRGFGFLCLNTALLLNQNLMVSFKFDQKGGKFLNNSVTKRKKTFFFLSYVDATFQMGD